VTAAVTGFVTYELILKNLPGDAEQALENKTSIVKGPETDEVIHDDQTSTGASG